MTARGVCGSACMCVCICEYGKHVYGVCMEQGAWQMVERQSDSQERVAKTNEIAIGRQADRQTDRQSDSQSVNQSVYQTDRVIDRVTESATD